MNSRVTPGRHVPMHGVAAMIALIPGCHLAVHPFTDEFAGRPAVTTASVEGVRAAAKSDLVLTRTSPSREIAPEDGTVSHGPLYFEDPYEESGSEDGHFAWTAEDYWQWVYWRGRFLLNAVAFPVSAVVTPPWTVMVSDGNLNDRAWGEKLDAGRR